MTSRDKAIVHPLEELCISIQDGDWIETKDQSSSGYRLLQIGNIAVGKFRESGKPRYVSEATFRRLNCTKIKIGDVLIARMPDPTGRAWCVDAPIPDSITSVDVAIVRVDPIKLNAKYLAYFLNQKSTLHLMASLQTGSTRQRIKRSDLSTLEILAHPIELQKAIAKVLTNLDEKIAANNALSKTLEDIAQTIFKSWFIDFDPVKAKMAGEKPAGMDAATAALFPNSMEESELGIIPKGWTINIISDFGKVVTGKTPSTKVPEYWGEQIPFVTIPDMHGQMLITSTARALSQEGADSQRSQNIPAGSTMVTCIATPGLVGYATKNCQTNQQINSVIPKVEQSSIWLFWHLRGLIPTLIRNSGIGTVFANLNKSDFSNIKSITPEMALREAFSRIAEPIMELLETLNIESQYLREIREELLPRLISGELQIPEEILTS